MAVIGDIVFSINDFGSKLTIDEGYEIINISKSGLYIYVLNDEGILNWYLGTIFTDSIGGDKIVTVPEPNTIIKENNIITLTQLEYDNLTSYDDAVIYGIIDEEV